MSNGLGLIFLLPLGLLIIGIYLLRAGLRARHTGGVAPHCGACGYNLTGLTSERCPECGVELTPDLIRIGAPTRSLPLTILGALLLFAFLVTTTHLLSRVDWYSLRPTTWVISDLHGTTPMRAWRELRRRIRSDMLTTKQRNHLIDLSLRHQLRTPKPTFARELRDVLGDWLVTGLLSDAQEGKLYKQMATEELTFTSKADKSAALIFVRYASNSPSRLWLILEISEVEVDGRALPDQGIVIWGNGGGGRTLIAQNLGTETGRPHAIHCRLRLRVYDGPGNGPGGTGNLSTTSESDHRSPLPPEKRGKLLRQLDIPLQATFQIAPETPEHPVKLKPNPSLRPAMQSAITPLDFRIGSSRWTPGRLTGRLEVRFPPANFAFDVFVRIDGREYPIGRSVIGQLGQTLSCGMSLEHVLPPFTLCDLILRTNERLVSASPEIFEIWEGQLTYKDVPVQLGPYATQPASASSESE